MTRSALVPVVLTACFAVACGSDSAPTQASSPEIPSARPEAPSAAPVPSTAVPEVAPSTAAVAAPDPALAALLPDAPGEVSLAHARSLAHDGTWLEAAAVYDALAQGAPTEARYVAGRGFALASCGDPRALPLARADYLRALELATDDPTRALVHYDLGLLDEHAGHTDDARAHYAEANRLRPSHAAAEALARTGGVDTTSDSDALVCELEPTATAEAVADLRAVVALLVRTEGSDWIEDPDDLPLPTSEAEAAELLCHGHACDVSGAFVSDFVLTSDVFEAHVVVPRPSGGYWVIPRVGPVANGIAARCPDELRGAPAGTLARPSAGSLVRVHVTWLENFWNECFGDEEEGDEEEECLDGCWWDARKDLEILVDAETGRYAIGSARRALDEEVEEGPSLLPPEPFTVVDGNVVFTGCGHHDRVTL